MLDKKITPYYQRILEPLAKLLVRLNISANTVSFVGFFLGLISVPLIIEGYFLYALIFIILNRILDGLDGIIARKTTTSNWGAFLDFTLDCVFYAMVPLGFALHNLIENATSTLVLLVSFVGTSVTFLSFSIIAERNGIYSSKHETKGIYYGKSFIEGFETILFFILFCIFPKYYNSLAYLFAIGCIITIISRLTVARSIFK